MKWMFLGVLALAACESKGGAGATTGGLQNRDGGVTPLPGEQCGANAQCATGKTYQQCQAPGNPCVARFITSDGQAFNCTACGNCSDAATQVTTWCGGGDAKCKEEATAQACGNCCVMAHPDGNDYYNEQFQKCACDTPGTCALDCETSFCTDPTSSDLFCDFCLDSITTSCDQTDKCMTNADCKALYDCVNSCP